MKARRQLGLVLPALLICLIIGATAWMFGSEHVRATSHARQQEATRHALSTARQLLLNYAQTYHLTHANESVGYLPCPDLDNDGSSDTCGTQGQYAIGRFPSRTLGSPTLRDGFGQCLWYLVAGGFKNNPPFNNDPVKDTAFNWDTGGQFIVRDHHGNALHHTDLITQYAVAVVFAPGPPLPGQQRNANSNASCDGADDAAVAWPAFLEGGFAPSATVPIDIAQGSPAGTNANDQLAWLSAEEVFSHRLATRQDVGQMIDEMLQDIVNDAKIMGPGPGPIPTGIRPPSGATSVGLVDIGGIPDAAVTERTKRWSDHLKYLHCRDDSACMTRDDGSTCRALVLFAGTPLITQPRTDPNLASDYFEGDLAALVDPQGTAFTSTHNYDVGAPSTDLTQCITF